MFRMMQGIGMTGFGSASYAYVTAKYPDQAMSKIAMIELFTGLGLMAGPLLGAGIYSLGGYVAVFLGWGSFFFLLLPYLHRSLPEDAPYEPPKVPISYYSLLKIRV